MATYVVITYRCPRCKTDIGRRFGLMTTLRILCPRCGTRVRIDAGVVAQNWAFNFGWVGFLLGWAGLGLGVLASTDFAAWLGGNTFPSATPHDRLVLAGMSVFYAILAALVLAGVGMLLGGLVAFASALDPDDPGELPAPPPSGWPAGGCRFLPPGGDREPSHAAPACFHPPASAAAPPRPLQRGFFVRAFFALLWPVVFFFAAALVLSIVAMSRVKPVDSPLPVAGTGTVALMASPQGQGPLLVASSLIPARARDYQLRQQASAKIMEQAAPWLLLGMLVVFVLGCAGLLPCTSRQVERPAAPRRAPAASGAFDLRNYPIAVGPAPRRRNVLVRCFFALLWPTLFFFAGGLAMSALSDASSAENDVVRQQIVDGTGQVIVPWLMLGSLIVFVLGCVGLLPWTGRNKRSRAAVQAAPAVAPSPDNSSSFSNASSSRNHESPVGGKQESRKVRAGPRPGKMC